jgi:pantetheine-phosphate adenylyltransferase
VHSCLSSSLIKEIARLGGDVTSMVPSVVHERLLTRLAERA